MIYKFGLLLAFSVSSAMGSFNDWPSIAQELNRRAASGDYSLLETFSAFRDQVTPQQMAEILALPSPAAAARPAAAPAPRAQALTPEDTALLTRARTDLDTALQESPNGLNAHNVVVVNSHGAEALRIAETCFLAQKTMTLDAMKEKISSWARPDQQAALARALDQFTSYFSGNPRGTEVQLNILEIYSTSVSLAEKMHDRTKFAFSDNPSLQMTAKGLIVNSFLENHQTQGGCRAGYENRGGRDLLTLVTAFKPERF
ncbi:MAG: hypothetical protein WCG05_04590 [Alphaproteobacteria bacterium]